MIFTYKLLPNLPHPPQWLIDQVDFDLRPTTNNVGEIAQRSLTNWNGYTGFGISNTLRTFTDDYTIWVQKNITDNFSRCMLNYVCGSPAVSSTGAHTDRTRDYVIMYNLRTGGPDARLVFWQEKNQPVIRDRRIGVGEFENLIEIDSIKGPENSWYLVNTRVLHSTENIIDLRLNLQIDFDDRFPLELMQTD